MHGGRPGHVVGDLVDDPPLGAGQGERQPVEKGGHRVALATARGVDDSRGSPLQLHLPTDQGHLDAQQLVEHEASTGLQHLLHALGPVDAPVGLGPVDQPVPVADPGWHRVGQAPDLHGATQGLADQGVDVPAVEARRLALRVDGDDPTRPVPHQVDHRAGHLEGAPVLVGLAEHHGLHALPQLLLPPRLVEEGEPQAAGVVATPHLDQRLPVPSPAGRRPVDADQDHALDARGQLGDGGLPAAVEVATRVEAEEVEDGDDPDGTQGLLAGRSDAVQVGDRAGVQFPQGNAGPSHGSTVPPASVPAGALLDAYVVRVERLSALVHLDLDARSFGLQPGNPGGRGGLLSVLAGDQGDDLVVVVDEGVEQAG